MNNLGRGNWVLMFGLLAVGMAVFVGAVTPDWNESKINLNHTVNEGNLSWFHNLSDDLDSWDSDIRFEISPTEDQQLYWINDSTNSYTSEDIVSSWISILNSIIGNLTINATDNSQTGWFRVPIKATNISDTSIAPTAYLNFIINATNDAPEFKSDGINNSYTFDSNNITQTFYLNATDEEDHFPLSFNITFNSTNCTHGANTGYADNGNCNLFDFGLTLADIVNESANISFAPNSSHVGTYWANISVMDAAENYNCPHDYCDATYNTTNLTTYYSQMVKFTVAGVLEVDVSNCSGATLMEDEQFNCTIVITTPGETDDLTLTSVANFSEGRTAPGNYNSSWFQLDNSTPTASNFNYNVTISVTPSKVDVGNLTINFTADNGVATPVSKNISIYVNFTEDSVALGAISNLNGSDALYANYTFQVNATDEDLLILDTTVKTEVLNFDSNTSWVSVVSLGDEGNDYITANITIDHASAIADNGTKNYTILINVTDEIGNTDNKTFVVEILNTTAPTWNNTLDDPLNLSLMEDTSFTYNVSVNVSDNDENDTLTFYYENNSAEFCSLNSSNFNSTTGIINFTPVDCDVGYHNVTITASDGKLNSSHEFNFTVTNIADVPEIRSLSNGTTIEDGDTAMATENTETAFELVIDDDDFLIPTGQKSFYNESLTINVTAANSSGFEENLFEFSFFEMKDADDSWIQYNATFTPNGTQADNYTIVINITDNSSNSVSMTFYLNVSEIKNDPILTAFDNHSLTIYDYLNFTVNATDDEDNNSNLNYSIANITAGSPNLTIGINNGSVEFNMSSNSSYAGAWQYNITVTDSDSQTDSQTFYVYVYGNPNITVPASNYVFNWTESNATGNLIFNVSHAVNNTNLTYKIYIDKIVYYNATHFNYTNTTMTSSDNLRNSTNWIWVQESNFTWNYTPTYTDETYGFLKNLTLIIFNSDYPELNDSINWKVNVTHMNQNVSFSSITPIQDVGPISVGISTYIDLSQYFTDVDFWDKNISQIVNFTIETFSGTGVIASQSSVDSDWNLTLTSAAAVEETIYLVAYEWNDSNISIGNATSNQFNVTFIPASTTPTPTPSTGGGGGSKTKLKHFSLKLVIPQDIIISDKNYIEIPFSIQNNGQMNLRGINLSSFVKFNDMFTDDVRISLGDNYIEELKFGQSEDFTMGIIANTQRAGRYKATILADVNSPKFSDWGDFIIEIKKANESEAEQILIFTEKIISENPECLELTELLQRAEDAFALGDYSATMNLAREATEACEDAIKVNEQIRYKIKGEVRESFYYISFATLAIFFIGLMFYIYKRVRFNKYKADEYI